MRRTSPSPVTRLAARSTLKSAVSTTGALGRRGRCGAGGPQAGEQLVHAERLGDVVVGAGVEGGDLVVLGAAADSTMIGHRGPAPQALDHLDAVDAGQTEVEDDDVGMVAGASCSASSPVGGQVDLVAAGPQVGRQRPADRARRRRRGPRPSRRRPPVGLARRHLQLMTIVVPPPGVSSTSSSPPMASTKPRATARPRPTPAPCRGSPRRWKGWNTRSSVGGMPGPRSTTRTSTGRATSPASTRTGAGRASGPGRWPPGWPPPARAAPGRRHRAAASRARRPTTSSGRSPEARERGGHHLLEADRPEAGSTAPAWMRLMSSRLPTRVVSRSVSSSMVSRNSARWAGSTSSTSGWRRLLADALIPASGVRRSCDTAWSRALRSSLASASAAASAAWAPTGAGRSSGRQLGGEGVEQPAGPRPPGRRPASASTRSAPTSGTSSAASSVGGAASPAAVSTDPAVAVRRGARHGPSPKVARRRCSTSTGRAGRPRDTLPASRARVSASARARGLGRRPARGATTSADEGDDRGTRPGPARSRPRRWSTCGWAG